MSEQNNNPSMNPKIEQMLQDLAAQLSVLTTQVNEWIIDANAVCGKKCQHVASGEASVNNAVNTTAPNAEVAKRRGRPPKATTVEATASVDVQSTTAAPAKRRGRPPKVKTEEEITAAANATPKRRGRPPKATTVEATASVDVQSTTAAPAKRRGRPPKVAVAVTATPQQITHAVANDQDETEAAWDEVDEDRTENSIPNIPVSMPPMPPPAFPPGAPAFPLA